MRGLLEEIKKKFAELDTLRILAILLVVVGHCSYTRFEEPANGLIALNDTPMLHETIYTFAQKICGLIYSFHMPLFFALSGMCYALNEHNEYTLDKFIWKKFDRLIIPFFLIGSLYMIPVKYATKVYPDFFLAERVFFNFELYGHLWFLVVLFEIFVIFRILRQYFPNSNAALVVISLFCYFVDIPNFYALMNNQNPAMIAHTLTYLIWFVLGYILYKEQNLLQKYLQSYSNFGIFVIVFAIFLADFEYNFFTLFFKTLFGCIATYFLAVCLTKTRIVNWSVYDILLKYSFPIYLFHDPINYVIIHAFSKWHWIENFPTLAAATFIGMRTVVICFIAIAVAYFWDKSKMYIIKKLATKSTG